jgi:hypothetical protein
MVSPFITFGYSLVSTFVTSVYMEALSHHMTSYMSESLRDF